jgi:hypothetical protein
LRELHKEVLLIYTLAGYCYVNKIKRNEANGECDTNGGNINVIHMGKDKCDKHGGKINVIHMGKDKCDTYGER